MNDPIDPTRDPFLLFQEWLERAQTNRKMHFPTAACLATSTADGAPSVRMVLVKEFDTKGFHFYTNYQSRKSHELALNPQSSLCYYWDHEKRQVRIEGIVEKLSTTESRRYFHSRPRESQIGAWASDQSKKLKSREELEGKYKSFEEKFQNLEIPLPEFWGGYRLIPYQMEFWQEAPHRLHERVLFTRKHGSPWEHSLLSP